MAYILKVSTFPKGLVFLGSCSRRSVLTPPEALPLISRVISINIMNNNIDYSWQNEAKCQGMDINKFYLTHGNKSSSAVAAVCAACPVKEECLIHALRYEEYGYWGGTGPTQRIRIRKQLGIKLVNMDFDSTNVKVDKPTRKSQRVCGTYSGYKGHRLKNEDSCQPCKNANNEYIAELKLRKKDKVGA